MDRLTRRKGDGTAYVQLYSDPDRLADVIAERARKEVEVIERLANYEDLEEQGRLHISKAQRCPRCGKYELIPRADGAFYYCFACRTQITCEEAEAKLAEEGGADDVNI